MMYDQAWQNLMEARAKMLAPRPVWTWAAEEERMAQVRADAQEREFQARLAENDLPLRFYTRRMPNGDTVKHFAGFRRDPVGNPGEDSPRAGAAPAAGRSTRTTSGARRSRRSATMRTRR